MSLVIHPIHEQEGEQRAKSLDNQVRSWVVLVGILSHASLHTHRSSSDGFA